MRIDPTIVILSDQRCPISRCALETGAPGRDQVSWIDHLPLINAILNTTSACLLLAGYAFIKRKNITAHRRSMLGALCTSALFLTSYLVYHYHVGSVRFQGEGLSRPIYFSILISHTILAAVVVPFILVTLTRALKGQFDRHRGIARRTLPMWAYVSVTGVVIYILLYQVYTPKIGLHPTVVREDAHSPSIEAAR
jgi:putative membrane protein